MSNSKPINICIKNKPLVAVLAGNYSEFRCWSSNNPEINGIFCDKWPRFAGLKFKEIIEIGSFRS
jgi:hypothetical protein